MPEVCSVIVPLYNLPTAFQDAYHILLVLGGYDDADKKPYLASMDYLGTHFEAPYLMQGYGGRFGYALMDKIYRPGSNWIWECT